MKIGIIVVSCALASCGGGGTDGLRTVVDDGELPQNTNSPVAIVQTINIASPDGGNTLTGSVQFVNADQVTYYGSLNGGNAGSNVNSRYQTNSSSSVYTPGGRWVIGARDAQHVISLDLSSSDNGNSLQGSMTYAGEGPIGFTAARKNELVAYDVQNSYGNEADVNGGIWALGSRGDVGQRVVAVDIDSEDGGATFSGTITYSGEGPIGFKATRTTGNTYKTENQFGGAGAPWYDGGYWLIGGRNQRCVELKVFSADDGESLIGVMAYLSEGSISFTATRANGQAYLVENRPDGSAAPWSHGGIWILGGE